METRTVGLIRSDPLCKRFTSVPLKPFSDYESYCSFLGLEVKIAICFPVVEPTIEIN